MHFHRVADAKLAEHWEEINLLRLMRQFGVLMSSDLEHYTSQALMRPRRPVLLMGQSTRREILCSTRNLARRAACLA